MNLSLATRSSALSAALLLALPFTAQAQGVQLQMIGAGSVTGISEGGKVATGQLPGNYETFRWTAAEGMVGLGRDTASVLDGQHSGRPTISRDGRVIAATIIDDTTTYATEARWTAAGGWQQLGPVPADGGQLDREDSSVWGMSGNGKVITGLYWRPGQPGGSAHGSVWRASTGMQGLTTEGASSRVDDANMDGSVLVGWEEDPVSGGRRSAVWVNGVRTVLDTGGEAAAVSADGSIVAGQSFDPVSQRQVATTWRWDGSQWVVRYLGVLHGTSFTGYSYATGVSDDGRIVVGFNRKRFDLFETRAFIWTEETGMVDVMDFLKSRGKDISAKFTINFVPAITGKGDVLAVTGKDVAPPFTQRSLLIKLRRP